MKANQTVSFEILTMFIEPCTKYTFICYVLTICYFDKHRTKETDRKTSKTKLTFVIAVKKKVFFFNILGEKLHFLWSFLKNNLIYRKIIWSDTIIESDVQVCPTELVDDKIQSVMENHFGQTSSKIQPRIFYVSVKKNLNKILI